jgi:hypothetical protein
LIDFVVYSEESKEFSGRVPSWEIPLSLITIEFPMVRSGNGVKQNRTFLKRTFKF